MTDQQGWTAPGGGQPPSGGPDAGQDQHQSFPENPPPPPPAQVPPPPANMPMAGIRYEYRPGIIALRPQTLSDVWGGVMTAIRGNPAATIGLALVTTTVVLVPLTLIGIWVSSLDLGLDDRSLGDPSDPFAGQLSSGALGSYVPTFAPYAIGLVLPLFMAFVIGQGVQGRKVGLGQTWAATRGRVPAALGLMGLYFVGFLLSFGVLLGIPVAMLVSSGGDSASVGWFILGVLATFVVFVYLFTKLGFATSIIVLETAGPVRAIRRSFALTRGPAAFWRIFGIRLLTAIVVGIAGSILSVPLTLLGAGLAVGTQAAWLLTIVQSVNVLIQSVLTTPFVAGVDSLLYVDQRIRREGLDMQLIQQAQAARPS